MIKLFPRGRGLGYPPLVPSKTHSSLESGNEWYRVMDPETGRQRRSSCPTDTDIVGCTLIRDAKDAVHYAWGQREIAPSEFVPTAMKPAAAPTWGAPTVRYEGSTTPQGAYTVEPIAPTERDFKKNCRRMYDQWAVANPDKAQCMTRRHRRAVKDICMAMFWQKTLSQEDGMAAAEMVITEACGSAVPIPPAPTPGPTDDLPPPYSDAPSPGGIPINGDGDGVPDNGYGIPTARPIPVQPSPLRQWGQVVGIGLILAIALTAVRKRKRRR